MSLLVSFQRVALLVAIFQGVFIFSNTWVLGWLNTIPTEPRDRYPRQFAVGDSKTLLTTLPLSDVLLVPTLGPKLQIPFAQS